MLNINIEAIEYILSEQWAYACTLMLLFIGLYGMLVKDNLVKKLIGMNIFQGAIILLYLIFAYKRNASVPVFDAKTIGEQASLYMNPIPHGLMLTAIVVSVAITGVGLSLLIKVYRTYGTLEESEVLKKMRQEQIIEGEQAATSLLTNEQKTSTEVI